MAETAPTAPVTPSASAPPTAGGAPAPDPQLFPLEHVQELRNEAAGWRTKLRETEKSLKDFEADANAYRELKKTMGAGANGQPADPNALLEGSKAEIAKRDKQIRDLKVEKVLHAQFAKQGVDPDLTFALLQSRLDEFDPESPDFTKTISAEVKKLAEQKPAIKLAAATPAPPSRSGGEFVGPGQTPTQQWTMEELNAARRAGKVDDVNKALREGKLNTILGRK